MDLRENTIKILQNTIKSDKEDLVNLTDPATRKIAGIRGMLTENNNEISNIKQDLNEKKTTLAFLQDQVTSANN